MVARIDLVDLLRLTPQDVLRLAMLLALRSGDLDGAAEHARRLAPTWTPHLANDAPANAYQAAVMTTNRLVRELHDPAAEPGGRLIPPAVPVSIAGGAGAAAAGPVARPGSPGFGRSRPAVLEAGDP